MTAAEALTLPVVSAEQMLLQKLLFARNKELSVNIVDKPWQVSLDFEQEISADIEFVFEVNGKPLSLYCLQKVVDDLMPANLDCQHLLKLPPALMQAALKVELEPIITSVSQLTGYAIQLKGLTAIKQPPKSYIAMILSAGEQTLYCYLSGLDALSDLSARLPQVDNDIYVDVPVFVGIELGVSKITHEEYQTLETGDIVFIQKHVSGNQVILRLHKDITFVCEMQQDNQITVKYRTEAGMDNYEEQEQEVQQTSQEAEGMVSLAELDIELLFEIGTQTLSLEDLQSIEPGYVFELDRPLEQPVRVRANGKVIAECQLVQVNNRLGARITRII